MYAGALGGEGVALSGQCVQAQLLNFEDWHHKATVEQTATAKWRYQVVGRWAFERQPGLLPWTKKLVNLAEQSRQRVGGIGEDAVDAVEFATTLMVEVVGG